MKESISYTFVLNIVIMFIFICAAVIMGIFSYFRAYKANTIIINEIEKYEGYNCLSAQTIAQKLSTISYNVPFDAKCKSSYDKPCMTDENKNYVVISYNLDHNEGNYVRINDKNIDQKEINDKYNEMNTKYECTSGNCSNTKKYQYGVYTYMYVDLPIVSSMIRIPVYTKSSVMYEFRNILSGSKGELFDLRNVPNENHWYGTSSDIHAFYTISLFADSIIEYYTLVSTGNFAKAGVMLDTEHNTRKYVQYDINNDGAINSSDSGYARGYLQYTAKCGIVRDYSKY